MANTNQPQGFKPKDGALRSNIYIAGGTISAGDAVMLNSSGQVVTATVGSTLLGAAATPATTGNSVWVWDHPDQLFVIQSNGTAPATQADIFYNYNIVAGSANTFGVSGHQLDGTTKATTAGLQLKLLAIEGLINNALGTNVKCICQINNHYLQGGTGQVGV